MVLVAVMSDSKEPTIQITIKGSQWTYADESMILMSSGKTDKEYIVNKLQNIIKTKQKHDV